MKNSIILNHFFAGDVVSVTYAIGRDDTPLFANTVYLYNGFMGFKI